MSPASTAGVAASVPIASRSAARHTNDGSPTGSAAASCSRRRVSGGSAASRRRKLSSMRLGERHRAGEPEPARQLRRRHPPRQLQQRQRVAARLGDDLVADPRVQGPGQDRVQQRTGIVLAQTLDDEFRQSGQLIARHTSCEHQTDRFRLERGARRTRGPALRPDRATARHPPRRSAAAPQPRRRAGSAPLGR